jgi:hypothetical protein
MIRPEGMLESSTSSPRRFLCEKHRIIYRAMLRSGARTSLSTLSRCAPSSPTRAARASWRRCLLGRAGERRAGREQRAPLRRPGAKKVHAPSLIDAGEFVAELGFDEAERARRDARQGRKKIYEVTSTPTLSKFTSLRESLNRRVGAARAPARAQRRDARRAHRL